MGVARHRQVKLDRMTLACRWWGCLSLMNFWRWLRVN